MDIYSYLKKDHRAVANLMQRVIDNRDPEAHEALFDKIRSELVLHLSSEEQTFYRAIELASRAHDVDHEMHHAEHEHDEVRDYLRVLGTLDVNDEGWIETFGEFKHAVAHHVEEEETEVWEKARACLTPEHARRLANDMDAVKREMRANYAFHDAIFFRPAHETVVHSRKI